MGAMRFDRGIFHLKSAYQTIKEYNKVEKEITKKVNELTKGQIISSMKKNNVNKKWNSLKNFFQPLEGIKNFAEESREILDIVKKIEENITQLNSNRFLCNEAKALFQKEIDNKGCLTKNKDKLNELVASTRDLVWKKKIEEIGNKIIEMSPESSLEIKEMQKEAVNADLDKLETLLDILDRKKSTLDAKESYRSRINQKASNFDDVFESQKVKQKSFNFKKNLSNREENNEANEQQEVVLKKMLGSFRKDPAEFLVSYKIDLIKLSGKKTLEEQGELGEQDFFPLQELFFDCLEQQDCEKILSLPKPNQTEEVLTMSWLRLTSGLVNWLGIKKN